MILPHGMDLVLEEPTPASPLLCKFQLGFIHVPFFLFYGPRWYSVLPQDFPIPSMRVIKVFSGAIHLQTTPLTRNIATLKSLHCLFTQILHFSWYFGCTDVRFTRWLSFAWPSKYQNIINYFIICTLMSKYECWKGCSLGWSLPQSREGSPPSDSRVAISMSCLLMLHSAYKQKFKTFAAKLTKVFQAFIAERKPLKDHKIIPWHLCKFPVFNTTVLCIVVLNCGWL